MELAYGARRRAVLRWCRVSSARDGCAALEAAVRALEEVSAYGTPMQSPVPDSTRPQDLRHSTVPDYTISGTDISYGTTHYIGGKRYHDLALDSISGTDTRCAATSMYYDWPCLHFVIRGTELCYAGPSMYDQLTQDKVELNAQCTEPARYPTGSLRPFVSAMLSLMDFRH
eukprot:2895033-Rhodomonas_salina.1